MKKNSPHICKYVILLFELFWFLVPNYFKIIKAFEEGHLEVVELLLNKNADINFKQKDGTILLMIGIFISIFYNF